MGYHREEPRENTKIFVTVEGNGVCGHKRLEALVTDVSYSGIGLQAAFPFEVNSRVDLYVGGELAAKGEVANVITDDTQENAAMKTRIGVQITDKYKAWPYSQENL